MSCATRDDGGSARDASGACSRLRARWAKHGRRTFARSTLLARAFRAKHADESHRARLRVEIGRLRSTLQPLAEVSATNAGFALAPGARARSSCWRRRSKSSMPRCSPSSPTAKAWSSSALALALGASQRTVQRALEAGGGGQGAVFGRGRARRWMMPPVPGFPTTLLLPGPLPGG